MNSPIVAWHFFWYKFHSTKLVGLEASRCSKKEIDRHSKGFAKHNRWMVRNAIDVLDAYQADLFQKAFPKA